MPWAEDRGVTVDHAHHKQTDCLPFRYGSVMSFSYDSPSPEQHLDLGAVSGHVLHPLPRPPPRQLGESPGCVTARGSNPKAEKPRRSGIPGNNRVPAGPRSPPATQSALCPRLPRKSQPCRPVRLDRQPRGPQTPGAPRLPISAPRDQASAPPAALRAPATLRLRALHTGAQTRTSLPSPQHAHLRPPGVARLLPHRRRQPPTRPRVPLPTAGQRMPRLPLAAPPSGGTRDARRLQFAGIGSHPRLRPHRPWLCSFLQGPAPEPRGARRRWRWRSLAVSPAAAVPAAGSRGREGSEAAGCRAPGGPRLQSGGGGRRAGAAEAGASLRRTVREEGDPARRTRASGPAAPPRWLRAPRLPQADCSAPAPPSECAELAEPG